MAHYEQNLWRDMDNRMKTEDIFKSIAQLQGGPLSAAPGVNLGEQMGREAKPSFGWSAPTDEERAQSLIQADINKYKGYDIPSNMAGPMAYLNDYIKKGTGGRPWEPGYGKIFTDIPGKSINYEIPISL